jgi:hypothetical protein
MLGDLPTKPIKRRDANPLILLLGGVILASLLIIGSYVAGEVTTALSVR